MARRFEEGFLSLSFQIEKIAAGLSGEERFCFDNPGKQRVFKFSPQTADGGWSFPPLVLGSTPALFPQRSGDRARGVPFIVQ